MLELEERRKEQKRQKLSKRISVFQTLHVICSMNFDSISDANELAGMIDTVTKLEEKAESCIKPQSRWAPWASALQKRARERVTELMQLQATAAQPTNSLFSDSTHMEQLAEEETTSEPESDEWLRGWTAATTEALPEIQELEKVRL